MSTNNKSFKFYSDMDEIDLENEDQYAETISTISAFSVPSFWQVDKAKKYYKISLNQYLNSVQYAFDKGNFTSKKVSEIFSSIPEPASNRIIKLTLLFLFLAIIIFLVSCQTNRNNPYGKRVGYSQFSKNQPNAFLGKSLLKTSGSNEKGKEQLYIKRELKSIKQKETGSTSGSIWADSASPKNLITEFKPSRPGDFVTVNIPEDLQYKADAAAPAATPGQTPAAKVEPVKSMKFEVAGIEPGGDVYLRGSKTYTDENGEQRNIMVLAKLPRKNINNTEINAKDLTEVAVDENLNGAGSNYSTTGWDQTVSRKVSGYSPDLSAQTAKFDAEKKELDVQKKALADQQKALTEGNDRLKKDRQRLDAEAARARSLLDAATVVSSSENQASTANDAAGTKTASGTAPANAPAAAPAAAAPPPKEEAKS